MSDVGYTLTNISLNEKFNIKILHGSIPTYLRRCGSDCFCIFHKLSV